MLSQFVEEDFMTFRLDLVIASDHDLSIDDEVKALNLAVQRLDVLFL